MNKKLTISAKDEKLPFPDVVPGSKTPVLKLSNCVLATNISTFATVTSDNNTIRERFLLARKAAACLLAYIKFHCKF